MPGRNVHVKIDWCPAITEQFASKLLGDSGRVTLADVGVDDNSWADAAVPVSKVVGLQLAVDLDQILQFRDRPKKRRDDTSYPTPEQTYRGDSSCPTTYYVRILFSVIGCACHLI